MIEIFYTKIKPIDYKRFITHDIVINGFEFQAWAKNLNNYWTKYIYHANYLHGICGRIILEEKWDTQSINLVIDLRDEKLEFLFNHIDQFMETECSALTTEDLKYEMDEWLIRLSEIMVFQ
jgi:hypothetical protein